MLQPYRVALLPGDGVGLEVIAEAVKVLEALGKVGGPTFRFQTGLVGGVAIDATDEPLPAESIAAKEGKEGLKTKVRKKTVLFEETNYLHQFKQKF